MLSLRGQSVLLFVFTLVSCHRAGPEQTGPLTTADAVRRLSWEEASAQPRVHLSGTVTVVDDYSQTMFIQDRTGAVWASVPDGAPNFPEGSTIEMRGTATAIGQDRAIIHTSIASIGPGKLPELRQISRADLIAETKNYALGRLRMRIKANLATAGRELRFTGEMSGGLVEVNLLGASSERVEDYVGQEVELVGVPAPDYSGQHRRHATLSGPDFYAVGCCNPAQTAIGTPDDDPASQVAQRHRGWSFVSRAASRCNHLQRACLVHVDHAG